MDVTDKQSIYEKLGLFYLGRNYDLTEDRLDDDLLLYDSKDLCTHAVMVGMTGSGKTGLGVSLLEEAAIDQVPALIIDPKGDMANLLLNFPTLAPEAFAPWIDPHEAERQGLSPADFAAAQAKRWQEGLAAWGQDGQRVQKLADAADFTVYTPGSEAGVPLSIVSSFAAPPAEIIDDADLFRDRIAATATSVLSLLGIDADPVRSREHILLTIILDHSWRNGISLDLGAIIGLVQTPPVDKVGVMDLESFFPSKDRFELAMTLNNLLAAPGFAAWMQGEPLDVDRLLYTESGKPRLSILSIAHLSDSERQFFVSLLLNQTIGWMRTRSGTSSLRALLYIDEIFGYMPPVAEPPTKKPLLTLLKQARAFGLGVVLATQNPADLDYKGLSNIGTWFLGRLQTERDKERVLDGLEGASGESGGAFDRRTMSDALSNLDKRVFLMHNVHEEGPTAFHTRWALSYLSGPMTREQLKRLNPREQAEPSAPETTPPSPPPAAELRSDRVALPPDIPQAFLPLQKAATGPIEYHAYLLGIAKVHFVDTRRQLSADEEVVLLGTVEGGLGGLDWDEAEELGLWQEDVADAPTEGASFAEPPAGIAEEKRMREWSKQFSNHLYRTRRFELFRSKTFKEISQPGENERSFRIRLNEKAHELKDEALARLRKKYATKVRTLEDRVLRAEQKVELEQQEATGSQMQSAISWGTTILSAVLSRKKLGVGTLGRAASAARGTSRTSKQRADVNRAQERLARYTAQLEALEREIEQEEDLLHDKFDPQLETFDTIQLKPRRSDIEVRFVGVGWGPFAKHDEELVRLFH